jgi:hypothetical protein
MKIKSNHLRNARLLVRWDARTSFFSICTNHVHQHEHKVFQMINGSVVVVVILQEIARVDQHLGHVFIAQRIRALQVGD